MKGDFTRFTFDRVKRYTQVLKQQGRVDLDADWNEQSAIDSYLDHVSRMDLSGVESGAPSLSPGFEVTLKSGVAGSVDLNLSPGRYYVEGLICELLDDHHSYLDQPFFPHPTPIAPVPNQTDLVFLDVWQRHITAIEDPSIREVALEGADTCTRVQTVFQVRIAPNVGAVDCPKAPLPQKSNARLTTSLVPVPPEDDLCLIGAAGGYKGLENRLYRVEVHAPGGIGTATFKWSRDNGSIVFPITEFVAAQPNKIRVKRLGRDQVLTLHEGDFVEVLDDNNELLGQPGTIAQVQAIDAANLELTLSAPALSAPTSGNLQDHPKVRRWDQSSAPITVAAGPIALEDGIQVSFSGSVFQTGDYWMFAARATDGTIEILPNVLAQGIRHHYARLALVTWQGPVGGPFTTTPHDCRSIFPSGGKDCCCCTVTVGDGATSKGDYTDIQKAIDSLPKTNEFAEVCILSGVYNLASTVTIQRSNVLIRGCGYRARITMPAKAPAFHVAEAKNISFESLFVSDTPGIKATHVSQLRIADCVFQSSGDFSLELLVHDCLVTDNICKSGILVLNGSRDVRILHNRIEKGASDGVALGRAQENEFEIRGIEIRDNQILGNRGSGICTLFEEDQEALGINGITISGNVIDQNVREFQKSRIAMGGIVLENTRNARILHNQIDDNGIRRVPACGVFLQDCSNVDIEENSILDNGSPEGVIQADCIDFQTKKGPLANPFVEKGVTFTFKDSSGGQPSQLPIETRKDFTGLAGTAKGVIDLPAADSVELYLFVVENVSLVAFAGNTQKDSIDVRPTGTAQRVPLTGSGINRIEVEAEATFLLLEICRIVVPEVPGWQGGIIANTINAEPAATKDQAAFPLGYPAIRVHDNVVNTPAGHSLLIIATGQVSVENNSLTCNGARKQVDLPFPVAPFGLMIIDFGLTYAPQKTLFSGAFLAVFLLLASSKGKINADDIELLWDGRVAFEGNQVAYRALNGTIQAGSFASGIITLDACQITGNQFRAEAPERVMYTDLMAQGDMVCATGNAFSEFPDTALFSYTSFGRNAMTVLNQSMHCLSTSGSEQVLHQNNQVTITTLCPQFTRRIQAMVKNRLSAALDKAKPFSSHVEQAVKGMEKSLNGLTDSGLSLLEVHSKRVKSSGTRFDAAEKALLKKKISPNDPQITALKEGKKRTIQFADGLTTLIRRVRALPAPVPDQQMFVGTIHDSEGHVVEDAIVQLMETANKVTKKINETRSNKFGDYGMNVPLAALNSSKADSPEWQLQVQDKQGKTVASEPVSIDLEQGVISFVPLVLNLPDAGSAAPSVPTSLAPITAAETRASAPVEARAPASGETKPATPKPASPQSQPAKTETLPDAGGRQSKPKGSKPK